ncbi:hypothetical protein PVL29_009506 [Vitis rotundifolia]|uniref:Homoserine kinase n=1 Tax=Vitis rotundifolia TaxID=103349 RepID=A0AA38ZRT3_VITRO|nr:hypothetical protein PVL29_009506 [Vitis rotundifolia]
MAICFQSPFKPTFISPSSSNPCRPNLPSLVLSPYPSPPSPTSVKSFAPATVANLGPGFDSLVAAIDGVGDFVSLRALELTPSLSRKCLGSDWWAVPFGGKGLPLGWGQVPVSSTRLLSGYHADNVAPAIMGRFVLIRSYDLLELIPLKFPSEKELFLFFFFFFFFFCKTRVALPSEIGMLNYSRAGALGKALSQDRIVESKRAPLIPVMGEVTSLSNPRLILITYDSNSNYNIQSLLGF